MSEKQEYIVPLPTKKDGWIEIPIWLMESGALPYPKDKWTLPGGAIAGPGDTIVVHDGVPSIVASS